MDVRLPDGTLIQGVPDGMSKADLTAKLASNGYDVSKLGGEPAAHVNPWKREIFNSLPGSVARGVKDVIDTGAGYLSRLGGADEQTRVRAADKAGADDFAAVTKGNIIPAVGRVGGNIFATLPATAAAGAGVAAAGLPRLGAAISSGGFTAGKAAPGLMGWLGDMGIRTAGGAVSGGLSAGMVNPDEAGTGAMIGGAMPGAVKALGAAGKAVGGAMRGPAVAPAVQAAVQAARNAGYVIPPTQARPTLGNRLLEGFAGKLTTAQNASAKNQAVTARLAAEALGLPSDARITPDVLASVRRSAGQAYDALGNAGAVTPGQAYTDALDNIAAPHLTAAAGFPDAKASPVIGLIDSLRSPTFDAAAAVAKIKELRSAADDAFRTGNTDVGRASKGASKALEDALEAHLQQSGATAELAAFRDARQLIAKTYSVEKALNPTTGGIDARKLGAQLKAGKPLSGQLKEAGDFANRFPKAAQPVEGMGSLPQTSPLDWAAMGTLSAATANPLMMAGVMARPVARSAVLSPFIQNRLANPQSAGALQQWLAANPEAIGLLSRVAPVGLLGGQ